jgi:hypothetical protein
VSANSFSKTTASPGCISISSTSHCFSSAIMADSKSLPTFLTNTDLDPSFDTDIKDTHLIYDYAAQAEDGTPEKWRYEMWFFSSNRIVCKYFFAFPLAHQHPFSHISQMLSTAVPWQAA